MRAQTAIREPSLTLNLLIDRTCRIQPVPLLVMVHISKTEVVFLIYVQVLIAKVEQILSIVLLLFDENERGSINMAVFQKASKKIKIKSIVFRPQVTLRKDNRLSTYIEFGLEHLIVVEKSYLTFEHFGGQVLFAAESKHSH